MRILIFNWRDVENPWAGGGEINIHEQAKRWVRWGHSVTMLVGGFPKGRPYERETVIDGIQIVRRGGRFSVYLILALHYLRHMRGQYDVVVDVANGVPFFTPLFCRLPKVVLFHHVHLEQWFIEFPWPAAMLGWFLERWVVRLIYRNVRAIAISDSTLHELRRVGLTPDKVSVVHPGLDLRRYDPARSAPIRHRIVHVGRIKRYKRLDLLIRLVKDLSHEMPDVSLHLAGTGEDADQLKLLAEQEGVADKIVFRGYVSEDEKRRILEEAYVFVTPSMNEGWGLTVLEANACGVPAVAYDAPGLCDSIRSGETGILVQSADEMAAETLRLFRDEDLRAELSQEAIRWAACFSWEKTAGEFLEHLESAETPAVASVPVHDK